MGRTDVAAAANATVDRIVSYHTDPRGVGAFRRLLASIASAVNSQSGQHVYTNGGPTFSGYAASPQQYTGAANLGAGRVVAPRSSTLDAEKEASPSNAIAMALFAERMKAGRP
ncbi:MAG: hypothetical protein J0I40_06870 [Cellulomonas sp.]|uniref:hypothetical protein n=1 Tax=Cellulomonas sp. 73-92 TaxID=1895740 RepID=UPI00092B1579|nr:hypothetical protein [Cellulomonas sp. 73-92]MBN9375101.1 hypothetical protein [Cellulomonas sp.]OJV76547.1 MAG: hypothetical protein BGO37_10890 [Cellulomonas sp. 73-92]